MPRFTRLPRRLVTASFVALMVMGILVAPSEAATRTTFTVRATFQGAVNPGFITDTYGPPSGYPAGFGIYSDAAMNAFFNQTRYTTTGFTNLNIISGETYCAGCNGSFQFAFQNTSLTSGGVGVFGVGLDILTNGGSPQYHAWVTYGDNTTEDFLLPIGASFFGITSPQFIKTIHFGLANGGPTTSGSFQIDNLTIGAGAGGGGTQNPDLAITKVVTSGTPVTAGQNATYLVTGTNNGPGDATSVRIIDNLPTGGSFVSSTPSAGASCTTPAVGAIGGTVDCTWAGATSPGTPRTITITIRVCPETPCGTMNNRATISAAGAGPGELILWGATSGFSGTSQLFKVNPATGASTLVGNMNASNVSGLAVLGDGRLVAGASDDNTLESLLLNVNRTTGASTLIGPVQNLFNGGCFRLPDLTYDSATNTLWGYGDSCGSVEGLIRINQTTGAGTSIGASNYFGGGNGLAWRPATGVLYGTPFDNQSLVTFNTVTGAGTDVPGTIFNVPFRINGLAFHPGTGVLYGIYNSGNYQLVTLSLTTGLATIIGTLPSRLDAIAFEQTQGSGDPNPNNNTVSLDTPVIAVSNLGITKTDNPDPVIAGQILTYQLTVSNVGPSNAAGVTVVDTLDSHTSFLSATGATCTANGLVVTCNVGVVGAPSQCATVFPTTVVINMQVLVSDLTPCSAGICPGSPGGPLTNTATVSTTNCSPDPVPANNTATQQTLVRAGADVLIETPLITKFADSPVLAAPAGADTADVGAADAQAAAAPDQEDPDCITVGDILLVTQNFSNTGPLAFTIQHDNPGPEFEGTHSQYTVGLQGSCTVVVGGGDCEVTDTGATWNGSIPVGEAVQLTYKVRVKGGTPTGTELVFTGKVNYEPFNTQVNFASRSATGSIFVDCPPTVHPNDALSGQVHLPILNFQGQNDVCRTWIEVQNVGSDFSKAALVTWGEPGFCPPQCAGPLKVECSGLLKPGSTWNFLGAQVPSGSKSGILFSFTAKQLSQIGVNLGFDDITADVLCETLFFGVVGDCDDYRRFKKAYNEGLEFAGIPLDLAVGSPLAVEVLRHCPGDQTPGAEVSSKYGGIAGIDLGAYDPVFGGYAYYVPLLYAESGGMNAIMYIQNGGLECSSVEIWFKSQDDCLRARICEIFTLAPGESFQFDANDCVGPSFMGNAWLRSSQPLGIAVDIIGSDVLMTYVGVPTELNYTFDPDSATLSVGNQVAYGPLMYSEYQGWDAGIQVQNMSSVLAAKVKVYFLDRSGDVVTTLVDWICPRGTQTYFLPVVADLPGSWVGSMRVESQEWFTPGGPLVAPPNITGVATLIKYTDAARSDTAEAIAYNLLTEQRAYDWQIGANGGGVESGIGLIAIPSLIKDLDGTGVTSEIAITNLVPKPGFTSFAIYVYDQNGLLDYLCQTLNEKQVEYINIDSWSYVSNGFKGSAIISAQFWEHDVFDDTGFFIRNALGLAAVSVERTATRLGEDIPGDESAGTAGIPFMEDTEQDFFFDFEGPATPLCPGQPDNRPDPTNCPETVVLSCQDCPKPIPDLSTTMSTITVGPGSVPTGCEVTDVDVLIDLFHTFDSDLAARLSSPDIPNVTLFSGICGAADGVQAILDDEGAQPIGSVCPPTGFQRYNTQTPGMLTQFEGGASNGDWILTIVDQVGLDQGTLNDWELQFTLGQ